MLFASLAIHPVDLGIIASYVLATTLFGVWLGRGQGSTNDFFLGSRNLPSWALLISIVATETSTVTFLSVPGKAFVQNGDFSFLQLAMGYIVGRVAVITLLLPLYFKHENNTAYAVLQRNFGKSTRRLASLFFLFARTLGDGLRLFLTALALQQVVAIPLIPCVAVLAVATGIYALFGGVRSVVWNDCVQFGVYMTGALIAATLILWRLPGGLEQYLDFTVQTGRAHLLNYEAFPIDGSMSLWAGLVGGAVLSLGTHGADQLIVQRYLCARNQRSASWALFWTGPVVFLQFALFLAIGAGIACYFTELDPTRLSLLGDEAFASFIVTDLPLGIRGLILAAIFAAAMSTLSSSVNSSASSLLDDLGGSLWGDLPDDRRLFLARAFTVLFTALQGAVAIGAYYTVRGTPIVDNALAIAGFSSGLLLGLFLIAITVGKIAAWKANLALLVGTCGILYVIFQVPVHDAWHSLFGWGEIPRVDGAPVWRISGYWYSLICCGGTFIAAFLLSLIPPLSEDHAGSSLPEEKS